MSDLSVSTTFVAHTTLFASNLNGNFSDIVNYINNRDDGTSTWDNLNVTATTANPVTIKSNQATTEVAIDNTATDGDPILTFKLSGSQTHVIGVDDSDSDFLHFATTGIATNVAMQIPLLGVQVQFASANSVGTPAISFIGDSNTGIYQNTADEFAFSTGGTARVNVSSVGMGLLGGCSITTNNASANIGSTSTGFGRIFMADGSASAPSYTFQGDSGQNTGFYLDGPNSISVTAGGVQVGAFTPGTGSANTSLWVFDGDTSAVRQVTTGADDSGGAGFKVLRIANS